MHYFAKEWILLLQNRYSLEKDKQIKQSLADLNLLCKTAKPNDHDPS